MSAYEDLPLASEDLVALVCRLHMAVRSASAYPGRHPAAEAAFQDASRQLAQVLATEHDVSLVTGGPRLTVNGCRLPPRDRVSVRLAECLRSRDVRAITLRQGVELDDLTRLGTLLSLTPERLEAAGGLAQAFGQAAHGAITLTMARYDQVPLNGAARRQRAPDPLSEAVARYFAGTDTGGFDRGLQALLALLKQDRELQYAVQDAVAGQPGSGEELASALRRVLVAVLTEVPAKVARQIIQELAAQQPRFQALAGNDGDVSASDVVDATDDATLEELGAAVEVALQAGGSSREALGEAVSSAAASGGTGVADDGPGGAEPESPAGLEAEIEALVPTDLQSDVAGGGSYCDLLLHLLQTETDPEALAGLATSLTDMACEAIGGGDHALFCRIAAALCDAAGDKTRPVLAVESQVALDRIGERAVVEQILTAIAADESGEVRQSLMAALRHIGERARSSLADVLMVRASPHLPEAARALTEAGELGREHIIAVLARAPARAKRELVEALGHNGQAAARVGLRAALRGAEADLRQRAAFWVGRLRLTELTAVLGDASRQADLLDRAYLAREEAVRALAQLGTAEAVAQLGETARSGSPLARRRRRQVRAAVVQGLARMGSPEAVALLEALGKRGPRDVRAQARQALAARSAASASAGVAMEGSAGR